MTIINLQNTPDSNIQVESVSFPSNGHTLKGLLYTPVDSTGPFPGVIVTGAWTTVKKQMPGTYARELAVRGFAALAFDFTGWGQSEGDRRFVEDPVVKTADIHAAVTFMKAREDVDTENLSGLGVCASSGYMADAAADNDDLAKVALVAPWLHNPAMAESVYGGPDAVAALIAASEAEDGSAQPAVLTAASTTDNSAPMFQAPYYTEPHRGLIDAYDNKFSVLTWKPWLTYDAHASADRLTKPLLMVGSSGMALPPGAEAYEKRTQAPIEKVWFGEEVNQFDFYDRADIVEAATKAVSSFFKDAYND